MANKYTYSAPYTESELFEMYVNRNMTQAEIGIKYGISQHKVWKDCKRMKISSRVAAKRDQLGNKNSSWKGGKILVGSTTPEGHRIETDKTGKKKYYMVLCHGHPNANKDGYVFEHVKVALEHAKRDKLEKDECVHHINCVKTDNRPENLVICLKSKHRDYHASLENLINPLLQKGAIGFDADKGYFVK